MTFVPDLFARAREATTIEAVAGITLYRDGRDWRGECPLCGASKGSKANGAFWANYAQTHWMCFGCNPDTPEDVIELEHRLNGGAGEGAREAALRILGHIDVSPEARERREAVLASRDKEDAAAQERQRRFRAEVAKTLWREGLPALGSPVETYLRACGFWGWPLSQALRMVRYHPRAYHSGDPTRPVTAPGMIGLLTATHLGAARAVPTGGVHATYLRPDGSGKADLDPPRKKWGPSTLKDAAGVEHPGVVWLSSPKGDGPILTGEGLETVLGGATLYGGPCRMAAALDLRALSGSLLKDDRRLVNLEDLALDLDRPAFTVPGTEWVIACIDRDMSSIHLRTTADPETRTRLDAEDRAQLSARMVDVAWRRAGASRVELAYPPATQDVRDQFVADARSTLNRLLLAEILSAPGVP